MRASRTRVAALLLMTFVAASASPAQTAAKRMPKAEPIGSVGNTAMAGSGRLVALVIGNKAYPKKPLVNPENDARDLAAALKGQLGYEVDLVLNATRAQMARAVEAFTQKLGQGDVALFYFSGHGMQIRGENYLLPVDFTATSEGEVEFEGYPARRVMGKIADKGVRLQVLILDACRDNPYKSWRSGAEGLSAMKGATGAFIAFAAGDGAVADDNPTERNGLFTKHLLRQLALSGATIDDVFNGVREGVWKESNGRQVPFSYSGVIGRYVLRPGAAEGSATPPASGLDKQAQELGFWNGIAASNDPADFEEYLVRVRTAEFPGTFRSVAERKAAALRRTKPTDGSLKILPTNEHSTPPLRAPGATADGSPIPVADLVAGTFSYAGTITAGGQNMQISTTRVVKEEGNTWVVTDTAKMPMGEAIDATTVEKGTLVPVKRSIKQGPVSIELAFAGGKATGTMAMGAEPKLVSADLGGALFADGNAAHASLACLPLAEGFQVTFRNFDFQKQKAWLKQAKVTGAEEMKVAAGTFQAWKVEITSAEGEPGATTLWVDKASRKVVKTSTTLPQGGGMVVTSELQP